MELVNNVANVCIKKYTKYIEQNFSCNPQFDIDILAHGMGVDIGIKFTAAINQAANGQLRVKNFIGKFNRRQT